MTEPAEYIGPEAPGEDYAEDYEEEPADLPIDADPADYADQLRDAGLDYEDREDG